MGPPITANCPFFNLPFTDYVTVDVTHVLPNAKHLRSDHINIFWMGHEVEPLAMMPFKFCLKLLDPLFHHVPNSSANTATIPTSRLCCQCWNQFSFSTQTLVLLVSHRMNRNSSALTAQTLSSGI